METTTNAQGDILSTSGRSDIAEGSLSKAPSRMHAAVDSIAQAADDAVLKARPAIDKAAAVAHQAVDKAASAAAPTTKWLADKGESLRAKERKVVSDTGHYIAANPLKSLGIAIAAGFLIGRIVRK